ncbi:MAG: DUF4142 domain-containing protein [Acidobacteriota bacterium]|nr:DUF4142 domain-containing protein [Acidobacteriota bacterium]
MKTTLLIATIGITLLTSCRTGTDATVQSAVAQTSSSSTGMNTVTDADAGAIARTINNGEIELAQFALTSASSQQVRDFAQMMITEHQNANAALESGGYGTMRNPVTSVLDKQVDMKMSMLRGMSGPEFDRAYIGSQIEMHQTALETMRTTLMPSAQDRKLRSTLEMMRDRTQMHLDQAREIQRMIGR